MDFSFDMYDSHDWDYEFPRYDSSPGLSWSERQRIEERDKKSGKYFFEKFEEKIELATKTTYLGENGADFYKISSGHSELIYFLEQNQDKKKTEETAGLLNRIIFKLLFQNHYTEHFLSECFQRASQDPDDFSRPQVKNEKLGKIPTWVKPGNQPRLAMLKSKKLSHTLFVELFDKSRVLTLDQDVLFSLPLGKKTMKSDAKDLLGLLLFKLGEGRMYTFEGAKWIQHKEQINQLNTREACKHFMANAAWYIDEFFSNTNFPKVLEKLTEEASKLPEGYSINEEALLVYTRMYMYSILCTALYSFFGKGGFASLEEGIVTLFANCKLLQTNRCDDDLIYGDEFLNCLAGVLMYCQFMPQHLQEQDEKLEYPLKLKKRNGKNGYYIESSQFYLSRVAECAKGLDFLPYSKDRILPSQSHLFKLSLLKNAFLIAGPTGRKPSDVAANVMALFGLQYSNTPRKSSTETYFSTKPYWTRIDTAKHSFGELISHISHHYENVPDFVLDESAPYESSYCEEVFNVLQSSMDSHKVFDDDFIKTYDSIHMGYLYKSIFISLWLTTGSRNFTSDFSVDKSLGNNILAWFSFMHDQMIPASKKFAKGLMCESNAFLFEKVYYAAMDFRKKTYEKVSTRKVRGQFHYEFGTFPNLNDDRFNETHDAEAAPRKTGGDCFVNYYSLRKRTFKITKDDKAVMDEHQSKCSIM